jgi:hypothetical protein
MILLCCWPYARSQCTHVEHDKSLTHKHMRTCDYTCSRTQFRSKRTHQKETALFLEPNVYAGAGGQRGASWRMKLQRKMGKENDRCASEMERQAALIKVRPPLKNIEPKHNRNQVCFARKLAPDDDTPTAELKNSSKRIRRWRT